MAQKLTKKTTKVQKVVKKVTQPVAKPKASAPGSVAAQVSPTLNVPKGEYTEGVGRRKVATARVRIYETKGDFIVNGKVVGKYFATIPNASRLYFRPLEITGTREKFAVTATVKGSGTHAQLEAVMHGLSRALIKFDPQLRPLLKAEGLLTRDDRMKETRKIGTGGKARRKRQSPKR